ncbi:MAG TPA: hypothetical protein DEP35_16855 [Deltaproteobacteria bacterium]|jgi:hypothetical protein|nr:hypothetical protein [Deltaproteobacteria bacterium]
MFLTALACSFVVTPFFACSAMSPSGSTDSKACSQNLDAASSKLDYAKSKGYSAKVEWAKAEALLAEAKAEQEAKHYDTCVSKVKEAQPYVDASLK